MNKAILMGRLTRDPELRTTQSGISVVSFTLAVDRRFKSQSGEREADFISCRAWRQTAEFIQKYFSKGSKLAVVGTIQTGSYEKDGRTVYTTDVVVDEAYFVESKSAASGGGDYGNNQGRQTYNQPSDGNRFNDAFTPGPSDDTSLPFDL